MNILLSFASLECDRECGVGAAYRAIRSSVLAGYMRRREFSAGMAAPP
jgi:hypothetical protein